MSSPDLSGTITASTAATGSDSASAPVKAAIARAAAATGVDFSYLLAQAKLESGFNPNAHAGTSSASGLYQFTNSTWAQTLAKHGDALGDALGLSGATAAQKLALRNDPGAAAMMAAELAGDNQTSLTNALGRPPQASELYLAHFLGADGAGKFLSALQTDPSQSASALLPKAAASNRAIFFDASGAPRSLGAVMALIKGRMDSALAATGGTDPNAIDDTYLTAFSGAGVGSVALAAAPSGNPNAGPIAQEFAAAQNGAATSGGSMADTLAATFGLSGDNAASAPDFVRAAYGRLQQLGF